MDIVLGCRVHYSSSLAEIYPDQLLNNSYSFSTDSQHTLVYSPSHNVGSQVNSLDLRLWEGLIPILMKFSALNIREVRLADIDGNENALDFIANFFSKSLKVLELTRCCKIDTHVVSCLQRLIFLSKLSLEGTKYLDDTSLNEIISKLPSVRSINVSECPLLTDQTLIYVSKLRDRLTELSANSNENFTFVGVNELVLQCENLETLNLSGAQSLKFLGVVIKTHGLLQFVSRNLKCINLNNCRDIRVDSLKWLTTANVDLTDVALQSVRLLNGSMVAAIASGCKYLRSLNIANCRNVDQVGIIAIASGCTSHLTNLNMSRIGKSGTSGSVRDVLANCIGLTILDISCNSWITDATFAELNGTAQQTALRLTSLNVSR